MRAGQPAEETGEALYRNRADAYGWQTIQRAWRYEFREGEGLRISLHVPSG